ncbi:MAG: imidazole glycerol phosphate synthase subunit HisH [Spirochaetes bacterium]|uniref:Imidazole glycerol phosphate synthase subunit HisH n=1 Tax=Candidatus Ornithospirochaeta stercoripullorum TaxID=2840899 RepID=A0A9D9H4W2_9SPIO|nr:imidazole glycerol phosphate synthase subunit HisH [Candidatus Ornithospirochaeta stercoripullorum]
MIAVIRYNAGNVLSVMNALSRLGHEAVLTDDEALIKHADKVIFPGVGEASSAMEYLNRTGLADVIRSLKQPFLGICLGMQLMCSSSEEGDTKCLGIFPETVKAFPRSSGYKIPHVGWNTISKLKGPLYRNTDENAYVYFVHSYYVPLSSDTTAVCNYDDLDFSASLSFANFHGMQFHPEKSGSEGERMLRCFLEDL